MICKFKFYGHYFAFDTASRAVHKLSEIQYDMLAYLRLPFEDSFPSVLRYDLAKYESSKLSEAYFMLKKLNADGVLASSAPLSLETEPKKARKAEVTAECNAKKFVFANAVIKSADGGARVLTVNESAEAPVKVSDYDIYLSEYERVAKEIIKRKSGRAEGAPFDFLPFDLSFKADENGYYHAVTEGITELFEDGDGTVGRKCAELAIAIFLE